MGALLGLAARVAFGVSDYVAGVAARRLRFVRVSLVGAVTGLAGAAAALVWVDGAGPQRPGAGMGRRERDRLGGGDARVVPRLRARAAGGRRPAVRVGAAALLLHELPDRGQPWGLLLGAVAVTAIVLA